jgi:hypothetical protein
MAITSLEEKLKIKQRNNFKFLCGSVKSAWSFNGARTWGAIYKKLGYDDIAINQGEMSLKKNNAISFQELNEYLTKLEADNERRINALVSTTDISIPTANTKEVVKESKETTTNTTSNTGAEVVVQVCDELQEGFNSDNDYGLHPSPKETANHFWFQKKAIKELYDKIVKEKKTGVLLLSGTGTGKSFMLAGLVRRLMDAEYEVNKTFSHIPYLYVGKTTILEQIGRVFRNNYNIIPNVDVEVINIEMLRSTAGQFWVKNEVKIQGGEEVDNWIWKKGIQPCVILFDESQGAKNSGSTQTKIINAYNNIPTNACLVSISATPFTRVSEAQAFAVSTHRPLDHLGFPVGTVLTNDNWPTYAAQIAAPADPKDYNQAAIERLMKDLEPWIVRVRGVKSQFTAKNSVKVIPFEDDEKRIFYETAWERFLKEKAKAEQESELGLATGNFIFTILLKQQMAAEMCHAPGFAKMMNDSVRNNGKAASAAVKFKGTIIKIVQELIDVHGWTREDISLIWGGGQTQLTAKQKTKKKIKELDAKMKELGSSAEEMIKDLDLEEVEDREILNLPEHLRLGLQSMDERQREIDRFQSGKSLFCIYTFRAGGVGLSLPHSDELTTQWNTKAEGYEQWIKEIEEWNSHRKPENRVSPGKCRRKESGYVFEQDIPFIPVRPRVTFVALTYNAIELIQGIGRVPRIISLSETEQYVICYLGTIEMDIGYIVSKKLSCVGSIVKQHEDWQDIIMYGDNASKKAKTMNELLASTEGKKDDEGGLIDEGDEE